MDHNNNGTGLTIAGDPAPAGGGGGIVRSRGNKIPSTPAVPAGLMAQVNADPQVRQAAAAVEAATSEFGRQEAIGVLTAWVVFTILNTFLRYIWQVGTNQGGSGGFSGEPGGGSGSCGTFRFGGKKRRRRTKRRRTKRRRKRRTNKKA